MTVVKTPGVYIVEKNAFPNSVVEVATAVPAFIGHTEKAENHKQSLHIKPWRIGSLEEYHQYFGGPASAYFTITAALKGDKNPDFSADSIAYSVQQVPAKDGDTCGYGLYPAMCLFFMNGGGACYVVSVGDYTKPFDKTQFIPGIEALEGEQEPSLLVIPEAVKLGADDCIGVQQAMLKHCGYTMRNRFAILDVWGGDKPDQELPPVQQFRDKLGANFLNFGAAYYPWLNASIVGDKELSYENIVPETAGAASASISLLIKLLKVDLKLPETLDDQATQKTRALFKVVTDIGRDWSLAIAPETQPPNAEQILALKAQLNKALIAASPLFGRILAAIKNKLNQLPPAAAMAGIYTMVDNTRGVWKAPANVSLKAVISPMVAISAEDQQALNIDLRGKSINAIRSFIGEGVLVWGARTLDGNSLDWRYINVRRTMIMLEESCRLAAKAMVFEPNVAGTWITIKSMIQNYLTSVWKRGGLAGSVPEDAFSVHVGLGETMTADDVLEGILRVTVLVAMVRPAEFIEVTFQQQMQKS